MKNTFALCFSFYSVYCQKLVDLTLINIGIMSPNDSEDLVMKTLQSEASSHKAFLHLLSLDISSKPERKSEYICYVFDS